MVRWALGRDFGWLWGAYTVSAFGTRLAFDAFPLIAVLVLHAGPAEVAALAAVGPAVGALLAVPLGPWVEFRRKRPVMITADLVRCAVLLSVPVAYWLGGLGVGQLLLVSAVVAAADISFTAASGAFLKSLLPPERLLAANGRFESTSWTATMLGPPLGGAAIGLFGPVVTVVADAVSYLLSAAGLRAIRAREPAPARVTAARDGQRLRAGDLLAGWRHLFAHPVLRPLFLNAALVNGLIMATAPPLAVLMLGPLGFAPWQYALAFAVPCVGGLIGSRLAPRLVARYGRRRVLLGTGVLRACWSLGLAFVGPGVAGLVLVMTVELGLIACAGVFNPVLATTRLELTPTDRVARTLSAWSVGTKASVAALTALWGGLAALTGPRTAIALAGALLLATPLLLLAVRRGETAADRASAEITEAA
ncbi:MFS transporter [Streptomyces sp. BK239]|uniref:MFS transporter n=1 Tax=Streptomyces sp. BK239 TaxID=2512155 RepID=UPI0010EC56C9|nr:MFS transporter [Streptomyces sp. BK239]RZU24987.1 MFS-type transporter involved in bile tolerance (Atg22 family) [Streptomyces sp. BK239]